MICTRCNEDKPITDYYKTKKGRPLNPCKSCRRELQRERLRDDEKRKRHNEKVRQYKQTEKGKASIERHHKKRRKYTDEQREQMRIEREKRKARLKAEKDKRRKEREQKMALKRNATEKKCRTCNRVLPIEMFYKYKNGSFRLDCRTCMSEEFAKRDATEERKAWRRNYKKTYREDPIKQKAQISVGYAIKTGKLKRPDSCSDCGSTHRIQAHHPDYSKPLEVIWLCEKCHKELHYMQRRS